MLTKTVIEAFDLKLPSTKIDSDKDNNDLTLSSGNQSFNLLDIVPNTEIIGNIYHIVDEVMRTVDDWGKMHTPKVNIVPLIKETIIAPTTEEFISVLEQLGNIKSISLSLTRHEIHMCASRVGLDNISALFTTMLIDMRLHNRMPELEIAFNEIWDTWLSDVKDYCMSNFDDCKFEPLNLPNLSTEVIQRLPPDKVKNLKRGIFERTKSELIDNELHQLRLSLLRLVEPISVAIMKNAYRHSDYSLFMLRINTRTRIITAYDYGDLRILKYNLSKGINHVW